MPSHKDIKRQAISKKMKALLDVLTPRKRLDNIIAGAKECTSDCASQGGRPCDCGAEDFKAKFIGGQQAV
jgi:hypothetical protein